MKPIKTVFTAMLVLVMVLSLAACSSANTAKPNEQVTQGQGAEVQKPQESQPVDTPTDKPSESVTETPENTDEPATSEPVVEPTESSKDEPLFDTSWAQNDFERMIPQPPFSGWVGEKVDSTTYEMEAANIDPEGKVEYYPVFEAYAWSLQDYGYSVTGEFNEFTAVDAKGNVVELLCGDGHAWITIKKVP